MGEPLIKVEPGAAPESAHIKREPIVGQHHSSNNNNNNNNKKSVVTRPIRAQTAIAKSKGWMYHVARLVGTPGLLQQQQQQQPSAVAHDASAGLRHDASGMSDASRSFSLIQDLRQPISLYRRLPHQAPDGTMMTPNMTHQRNQEKGSYAEKQRRRHDRYLKHHEQRMQNESAAIAAATASATSDLWKGDRKGGTAATKEKKQQGSKGHTSSSAQSSAANSARGSPSALQQQHRMDVDDDAAAASGGPGLDADEDEGLDAMLDQIAPFGGPVASVARQQHELVKRHKKTKPVFETTDLAAWRLRKKEWRNWLLEEADPPNFVPPRRPNSKEDKSGDAAADDSPNIPAHLQKQIWQGKLEGTDKFGYVVFVADVNMSSLPLVVYVLPFEIHANFL